MALNFQLLSKTTKEPQYLSQIDELICAQCLNVPVHPKKYGGDGSGNSFNWFDTIGYMLASGKSLEDGDNSVREYYRSSRLWAEELPIIEKIIDFLQARYTVKIWSSWGKQ